MVSGFNHIDLGTIVSNEQTLNQELFSKIKDMAKNYKPLICRFNSSKLGPITVVMNLMYTTYEAFAYISSIPTVANIALVANDDSAVLTIIDIS